MGVMELTKERKLKIRNMPNPNCRQFTFLSSGDSVSLEVTVYKSNICIRQDYDDNSGGFVHLEMPDYEFMLNGVAECLKRLGGAPK